MCELFCVLILVCCCDEMICLILYSFFFFVVVSCVLIWEINDVDIVWFLMIKICGVLYLSVWGYVLRWLVWVFYVNGKGVNFLVCIIRLLNGIVYLV